MELLAIERRIPLPAARQPERTGRSGSLADAVGKRSGIMEGHERHAGFGDSRFLCRNILDATAEECLMVAAHNSDLVAAGKCGLQRAFVARPTEYGPGQKFDLVAKHDFEYVASDFVDLAGKLGC